MQELCHRLDPSRLVTQGCDRVDNAIGSGVLSLMDVPGLNYRTHLYQKTYDNTSRGFVLGSETTSTVSSRGVYKFPVKVSNGITYPDGQCSGYDLEYCSWSNLPEDEWQLLDDKPWTIGEFVWTGFDYLGEPTPYDNYWPSRSSYFALWIWQVCLRIDTIFIRAVGTLPRRQFICFVIGHGMVMRATQSLYSATPIILLPSFS
jgi:beta-galactosidase